MKLFDMTESQLDRAVQSHYDYLYRQYYESDFEPCCQNCRHYYGGHCFLVDEAGVEMDSDDYCDDWESDEDG